MNKTYTTFGGVSMTEICVDCDEVYCEVCRVEEERKWAAHFANDRSTFPDAEDAYDREDLKGRDDYDYGY